MPHSNDILPSVSTFQHPLVRDLCWTLSSRFDLLLHLPPHRRFVPPQPTQALTAWLNALEREPQVLEVFLRDHLNRRLGHYFEQLVLFYFRYAPHPHIEVLKHNLPIYGLDDAGRKVTQGEIDFLLKFDDRILHLETAVKFYLGVDMGGGVQWIGPSLTDRFHRKLQHLRDHQLPLSQKLNLEHPIERVFWVKGVVFHPWANVLALLPGTASTGDPGYWVTQTQAMQIVDENWVFLTKPRWLGGAEGGGECIGLPERLQAHFTANSRVMMLTHRHSERRLLVVPDDWPERARAALNDYDYGS